MGENDISSVEVRTSVIGFRYVAELTYMGERALIDGFSTTELEYLTKAVIDVFAHCVRTRRRTS
jgi:hypothetical protein